MQRILVTGMSGVGKSTVAGRLSETPHNDDGLVWSDGGRMRLLPQEVNRHAVTPVRRLIGMWEVDPADMSDLGVRWIGTASTSYSG